MAEKNAPAQQRASFDYELYEGDPDHLRTVVATPNQATPWIDPAALKLRHRIGRGPFGDVWLATHHQSSEEHDRYHEVAVKMLHPIKEDHMQKFLDKFEEIFLKSRQLRGVCWLHGITIISGKICIAFKFYEGSVGDRIARLKGGKLSLPDVLRYGIGLAIGIQELHSLGILVLNIKPTNFLIDDHDQVVIGDFGIPYLLMGIPLPDSNFAIRLGTPSYMAPEQWEPEVRGPITFETDTWGFGCSIVEMLTGVQPWLGKSAEEIYQSVVMKQEKPLVPAGLPPAVENVINGCFEYDLRNRPLVADILHAFESSQNAVYSDGEWISLESRKVPEKLSGKCFSTWFLSKDLLQVGDTVRSRKSPNSCKPQSMVVPEGTIVGLEKDTDRDGFVLVRVPRVHDPLRINVSTLERVTTGLAVGDWVRLMEETNKHSSIGIIHSIRRDGNAAVGFLGLETLWEGHSSKLQLAEPYSVGSFVRLKANVFTPRFEWPRKKGGTWSTGRIAQTHPNGCLVVKFPGRFVFGNEPNSFLADPADVESVTFDSYPGLVGKYQHLEDYHWAARPLTIAFSVFTVMKFGIYVGKSMGAGIKRKGHNQIRGDGHAQDAQTAANSSWIPPPVANILFGEGPTATAR
ncbi:E3 ubiquitin-protein ligase KEG [Heracleum sosnowskyi]|uniref:E3 ubiquitin-protein ligase KEG n=1 Tax=Heracleum sosnowskyi TaxID=360622 RepID=A0AAD8HCI3_9APIA|nr:E3 ubiquitin-protein ligase KEG [Heracleum sosnowskyi]